MKTRLDTATYRRGMITSRSQAENYIKLGMVEVNGKTTKKPSYLVDASDKITIKSNKYVSRAAFKLASIVDYFSLDFRGKSVLDVGSSTGGFTDYALQHGASKVFAVDIGTNQLHPLLRKDSRIELHEKTDIREILPFKQLGDTDKQQISIPFVPDIIVIDVSFISLTKILRSVGDLSERSTRIIAMCKPQFEAGRDQTNKGIIKNSTIRRQILKDVEKWLHDNNFVITNKADSHVAGAKGNVERFYSLTFLK